MQSGRLREEIDRHCGDRKRVTVFWSCGGSLMCTTGKIVSIFDDTLVVVGLAPMAEETGDGGRCRNVAWFEVATLIALDRVCALVVGVPECRSAVPPRCCREEGQDGSGEGCM